MICTMSHGVREGRTFLLLLTTVYYMFTMFYYICTKTYLNSPFRTVSRGPSRGSPGPPGSVLRRFEEVRGSWRKLEKVKKVREGSRKLEKLGGCARKLRRFEKVQPGSRKLNKVGGSSRKLRSVEKV